MIYTHAAALIAGAAIAGVVSWNVQAWRLGLQISEINATHAQIIADAKQEALDKERKIQDEYTKALNKAREREASLRRDVGIANAAADGLREQAADAARKLANAPTSAVIEYATTAGELLAVCGREYQGMAEAADRHSSDVRTLINAWPKVEAKP